MTRIAVDASGWLGAVAILFAYWLVSTRRAAGDSLAYQLLNILGSLCLTVNTAYHGAIPSAAVNVVWMGIALFSIRRMLRFPGAPPAP
jgi:hypothetical protein